ncbi:hypothetical protein [Thermaurantimonas sp.]
MASPVASSPCVPHAPPAAAHIRFYPSRSARPFRSRNDYPGY